MYNILSTKMTTLEKKIENASHYQKNKEKLKARRRERYQEKEKKERQKQQTKLNQIYTAQSIQILMPLKDYTELNKDKLKI
jgi:hypothetical protein